MKTFDFTQARLQWCMVEDPNDNELDGDWRKVDDPSIIVLLKDLENEYGEWDGGFYGVGKFIRSESFVEGLGDLYWCNGLVFLKTTDGFYVPINWTDQLILNEF